MSDNHENMTFLVGPATMRRLFNPISLTNLADENLQALMDRAEVVCSRLEVLEGEMEHVKAAASEDTDI